MEIQEFQELSDNYINGEDRKKIENDRRKFSELNYCKICNKKTINLNGLSNHLRIHSIKIKDYIIKYELSDKAPLCKCGCGKVSKWFQNHFENYLSGHFSKTKLFNNPWSKKGRTPKNKLILSSEDKKFIIDEFVNHHKSIKEIAKKFNRSINPIKYFLQIELPNYFEIVRINDSWRKKHIPELNLKM